MDNRALYDHMVTERHRIWVSRQEGLPQPWTTDPVLSRRKFTNMFRVLDPGSQFVFGLKGETDEDTVSRLVFYRITNLPSTWDYLLEQFGDYPVVDDFHGGDDIVDALKGYRDSGNTVFSGAYIIMPEPGTRNDKIEGAVRVVGRFVADHMESFLNAETTKSQYEALRATPGLGKFLSMQVLTDWTYLQDKAPDLTFVVAGPGAIRGAKLLSSDPPVDTIHKLTSDWSMGNLTGDNHVNLMGRPLTHMDVQNTLCEFGKYMKERANPRKKSAYTPAHPGKQPAPILPAWW